MELDPLYDEYSVQSGLMVGSNIMASWGLEALR